MCCYQVLAAIAQPIFQVLVPIYPELWFNLQGRGTVTAVLSMSNIVGGVFSSHPTRQRRSY
jgi:FLVCR family MFS transporter 7